MNNFTDLVNRRTAQYGDKFDVSDLKGSPPQIHGRIYVFVDECHRTQGGKLNRVMKALMPNAVFIGFTGTPVGGTQGGGSSSFQIFGSQDEKGYLHKYSIIESIDETEYAKRGAAETVRSCANASAGAAARRAGISFMRLGSGFEAYTADVSRRLLETAGVFPSYNEP